MSKGPWFRARTGRWSWGWTPITWEGWLVTLLGVVVFASIDMAILAHFGALRH
jgi:hypothetical protein